jgi:autotransporter-associated beta strand protein
MHRKRSADARVASSFAVRGKSQKKKAESAGGQRSSHHFARLLLGTSFAALVSASAFATTDTWSGGTSVNWGDAANWSGGVPTTGQDVLISPSASNAFAPNNLNSSFTLRSITFGGSGNATTVANGYDITTTNSSTLEIQNGGFISDVSGNTGTDQINVGVTFDGFNNVSISNNSKLSFGQTASINGVLAINTNPGSSATFAQGITGTGPVDVFGTAVFLGSSNYTGGTEITSGTLQLGNGATNGTVTGGVTVDNGSTLIFDEASTTTFGGVISGQGSLDQAGPGKLILTGANTYSGGTTIGNGDTLQIGDGTTDGAIVGAVSVGNGGTLAFDETATTTFSGAISGQGSLSQFGTGTLILTGASTYSGGTAIAGGSTLQIGDGTTDGSIQGNVAVSSGGTLAYDETATTTFGGIISGQGALNQFGTGTLILTGANTYTGGTTIGTGSTLQIGSNGVQGSIAAGGNISDSGVLDFRNTTSGFQYGGVISDGLSAGSVALDQGTLVFTNVNTYSGGTTIASGATLVIGNVASVGGLNSVGAITDNGTLTFVNVGPSAALSGGITGTGSVSVQLVHSTDTVILTGTNTYSSGSTTTADTSIVQGVLQIGDLGTAATGSITGNAVLSTAGTLDFNNIDPLNNTFAGFIQGSGLLQVDSGTVILTNSQNFITKTTIAGGVLQIGDGTSVGSLYSTTITDNGTLAFDPPTGKTLQILGTISGSGGVNQMGSGTTVLRGVDSFNGDSTVSAGTLAFGANSFTGTGMFTVDSGATLAFQETANFTFANIVTGGGNLSQTGSATLILTGADTYTGTTTIMAPGTLQIGNGGTAGSISDNSAVTDNGTLAFDRSDVVTYGGSVSGTGALTMLGGGSTTTAGTGSLTLTGANTYSGGTNIAAGTLLASGQSNLGTGAINFTDTVANGATLEITSTGSLTAPVTLAAGGGTINSDGNVVTLSGVISGAGGLTVTDNFPNSGSLVLTGTNTYTGGTTITGNGTLQIGNGGGSGSIGGNVTDSGFLVFDFGGNTTFGGVISDGASAGQVVQDDTTGGTLVLAGANTYSGGTVVRAGKLSISTDANLGALSGQVELDAGTTLGITGNGTFQHNVSLSGDPTISVKSGLTANWSGIISDGVTAGTLNVSGGGTLQLSSGANTYTGGTTVVGGSTLQIDGDAELGGTSGGLTLGDATSGGTLAIATNSFTLGASRAVSLGAGGGTISTGSGLTFEIAQGISGTTGALNVSGTGTFVLAGTSSYTGNTNISTGATLQLGDGVVAGTIASTTVSDNGALVFNQAGAASFGATIIGTGSLTQNDTTGGTLTLTGTDTYTGGTTITAGTLQLGDGTNAGTITGNVSDGTALAFNEPGTATFTGVVSGAGSLAQNGTGTLILTGNNTYTGATNVNSGILQIGNGGASGSISGSSSIVNNGVIVVAVNGTTTITGPISGSGQLKQNAGTTVLLGNNSYSGTTTISGGKLQVGNGGTSGTLGTGDTVNNATLAFNRTDTSTYAGNISGTGAVIQAGIGTTILTGTNSYAGGTTISAGTLQIGNGATVGSLAGNVLDNANGTLAFDNNSTATYGGSITGAGALNKLGSGRLILAGANSFTGPTTVSAGVLQIGDGTTNGSLTSSIVDNGSVVFDRSDSSTYSGAISGGGSVTQAGTGTTVLTADGSYTGGTTISSGTLQLGSASATGSVTGNITDNGTLEFDRSNAYTFGGVISGSGGVTQAGGGETTLTGTNTYTGATSVTSGTLFVNGSIATSSLTTVASGGTIGGNGTVGKLTIGNNGTIAPGFGTLNVNGTFTMAAGSTYQALVTPTGSDLINVNGTAVLSGATLIVTPTGTGFGSTPIPILTASGGLTGTFSTFTVVAGPNQIPLLSYNADSALLSFVPTVTSLLPTSSVSTNQTRVADAVDFALSHDNAIQFAPVTSETGAPLEQTLSELSGETAVAFQNVAVSSVSTFMNTLFDPAVGGRGGLGMGTDGLADNHKLEQVAFNGADSDMPYEHPTIRKYTIWTDFYGYSNKTDGNMSLGTHRTSATQFGGTIGLDYTPKRGNGAIGLAVGITGNNWDLAQHLGKGQSTAFQIGGYYSRRFWENYITAGLSFAHYSTTTDRTLNLGGTNLYHAAFDSNSFAARAEVGHVFHTDMGLVTPFARFQAADIGVPHYAETTLSGSPSYALSYTSKQHYDYSSEVGGAWNTLIGRMTDLHARLGWLHDYAGGLTDTATFSAFNGATFTVGGASPPKDAAHLLFGIEHSMEDVTFTVNAEGAFAGSASSYGGTASISYRW